MNLKKIKDLEIANKKQLDEIIQINEKGVKNWQAEKTTVIYNIDQESLTNLTYKDSFEQQWKYDILKMLLCNLLKNTYQIDKQGEKSTDINFKANFAREEVIKLFKKKCFKSAQLKNLLLYTDNFRVDTDDTYNVYSINSGYHISDYLKELDEVTRIRYSDQRQYMTLNKSYKYFHWIKEKIYKDHANEIKRKDKEFINVWIPLICTIQEFLALTLANDKIKDKQNNVVAKVIFYLFVNLLKI